MGEGLAGGVGLGRVSINCYKLIHRAVIILKDTKIRYINKIIATQLGHSDPSEVIGKNVKILIADK